MRDDYQIEVEFVDKYQIRNNNYVVNFIVHSLREEGIDEFDSEYLYDNKIFAVRFSSTSSKICENIKHKLLNCFKRNLSAIDIYKNGGPINQWERNMDNPFRKAIEEEYPCNVSNNSSFAIHMKDEDTCYILADKLMKIGCEVVKISDTSFVCNYNKDKHNPFIWLRECKDFTIVYRQRNYEQRTL